MSYSENAKAATELPRWLQSNEPFSRWLEIEGGYAVGAVGWADGELRKIYEA